MLANKTMLPLGLSLLSLLFGVVAGAQPVEKTIAWYRSQAPFPMPEVILPSIPKRDFPIIGYAAIGDGKTLKTKGVGSPPRYMVRTWKTSPSQDKELSMAPAIPGGPSKKVNRPGSNGRRC